MQSNSGIIVCPARPDRKAADGSGRNIRTGSEGLALRLAAALLLLASPAFGQVFRVNCGSAEPFTDSAGRIWAADAVSPQPEAGRETPRPAPGEFFRIGGKNAAREADLPVFPEEFAGLLRSESYGMSAYRFGVPLGMYTVRLITARTHETLKGFEQQFTVAINGRDLGEPLRPFDVAGGFARAGYVTVHGVSAAADGLELRFGPDAGVNGIEIVPGSPEDVWSVEKTAAAPHSVPLPPDTGGRKTVRVLFIGHSGTFFWAIPETLKRMVALGPSGFRLETDAVYHGGKGVQFFFESPQADEKLRGGPWDFVVLMDTSGGPVEHPETFDEFMPRLIEKVRESGARPVLYAYSGPLRHTPEERRGLQERYSSIGRRLDVPVIPCAAALIRAMAEKPEWNFHNPDRHHVGMLGGYLFSCVWYRALTGLSAADLPEYTVLAGHVTLPPDQARELSALADAVCREYGIGTSPETSILGPP